MIPAIAGSVNPLPFAEWTDSLAEQARAAYLQTDTREAHAPLAGSPQGRSRITRQSPGFEDGSLPSPPASRYDLRRKKPAEREREGWHRSCEPSTSLGTGRPAALSLAVPLVLAGTQDKAASPARDDAGTGSHRPLRGPAFRRDDVAPISSILRRPYRTDAPSHAPRSEPDTPMSATSPRTRR